MCCSASLERTSTVSRAPGVSGGTTGKAAVSFTGAGSGAGGAARPPIGLSTSGPVTLRRCTVFAFSRFSATCSTNASGFVA